MQDEKVLKEFAKWGVEPPSSERHGTDEDIRSQMVKLLPNRWRLEGNKLTGDTEHGELVQFIPTDYICEGMDDKGLPILTKVVL